MNSPIRKIAAGCLLLCVALLVNVTYVQAFWADELNSRPENRRVLLDEYSRERGPILLADDTPIAQSVPAEGELAFLRVYPEGPVYAPLTGYYSYFYGRTGLERAQNAILSGDDDRLYLRRLIDLVTGEDPKGGAVKLTVNPAAQQAAYDGLEGNTGAVVALDVETGAILAAANRPSYDPNPMASHSVDEQVATKDELDNAAEKPALNRALAQTLPPGSVFKLVTAAAALESDTYDPDTVVPAPAAYDLALTDTMLPNQNGRPCGPNDQTTLADALRISCNTAFAFIGNDLGAEALREQAERFGFGTQPLTTDGMNAATSRFPEDPDEPQTALSAIGQFDVAATPLQIAMVSAAIANDGVVMEPYLVREVRGPDLVSPIEQTEPEERTRAISAQTAEELTAMMVDVVENGTGRNARIDGIQVAGKTGTAQSSPERPPYAWFTAFAPADEPRVAVAVVIENAPNTARNDIGGGALAAPVAKAVIEAVLGS